MFTGIIEAIGRVREVSARLASQRDALSVVVSLPLDWLDTKPGDSIGVDGICLTASKVSAGLASFDLVSETVARTTAASWRAGRSVNLERSLRLSDRLGGHIVTGHVDAIVLVKALHDTGTGREVVFSTPPGLARHIAEKGAVAVNGVSLTVARLEPGAFRIALIPETLIRTNLGALSVGEAANLEVDVLARYVERLLEASDEAGLSLEMLRRHGFA